MTPHELTSEALEALLNLLFASCMAGNIVLFLCIARSNATLPVQKKVQAAHLFRILLVAASVLCVIVLAAIVFLPPEIVWERKLGSSQKSVGEKAPV